MFRYFKSTLTGSAAFKNVKFKSIRQYTTERQCSEVRIPVAWGHVAGKWWGPKEKRPILALHGWQDNCGTFDTLVPYLPSDTPVLALDFPGHGLSSRFPQGMVYSWMHFFVLVEQITKYFEWSKVSLLGHSFGSILGAVYSVFHPSKVDFAICIDNFKPLQLEGEKYIRFQTRNMNYILKYSDPKFIHSEPPSYSWKECEKLLSDGSEGSVSLEAYKYLLMRSVAPSKQYPDKFYFTRDPRLKGFYTINWTKQRSMTLFKRLTCPILILKGKKSSYYGVKEDYYDIVDVVKKSSTDCRYFYVDGAHHFHLNNPELTEGHINDFLNVHDINDRNDTVFRKEIFI